jgi:hypothetical protein
VTTHHPPTGDAPTPAPADHLRAAARHLVAALPDAALAEARDRLLGLLRHHRPDLFAPGGRP